MYSRKEKMAILSLVWGKANMQAYNHNLFI